MRRVRGREAGEDSEPILMFVWRFRLNEMTRSLWAFYYYCKRKGDRCRVQDGWVIIEVERPSP